MFDTVRERLRSPLLLAAAGIGAAFLEAAAVEPHILKTVRVVLPVGKTARALHGVRLAHISDLHVGGIGWKRSTIEAAIDAVNREDIDLVAITGDFLGRGSAAHEAVEILERLRGDVPRFAVFGNHDHVYGLRHLNTIARGLSRLGIMVLNNCAEALDRPAGRIWVAGVDDGYSMRDDLDRVMGRLDTVRAPRILLTHYPEVADRLKPGEAQLSLAGHSHGGQIRLPILAGLVHRAHARTRYGKGLFMVNGNPLYVSSGLGMSGIPLRFLNPPEVAVISFLDRRLIPQGQTAGALEEIRLSSTQKEEGRALTHSPLLPAEVVPTCSSRP